ncbi:MAG: TolC family protein [Pirellulaceae bacterium]|nr:TolC family protein [Pirellulaceae bacterium]
MLSARKAIRCVLTHGIALMISVVACQSGFAQRPTRLADPQNSKSTMNPSSTTFTVAATPTRQFDVSQVLSGLQANAGLDAAEIAELDAPWWRVYAERQLDPKLNAVPAGMNDLIHLALQHAAQVRVYAKTPQIRETAVTQAAAAFDWSHFLDVNWSDTNEPIGSTLTVGNQGNRFNDHNVNFNTGFRRKTLQGASVEVSQQLGHQNTNSQFFLPNNQGTARFVVGYSQPLMRGRGTVYNQSLIVLANIDVSRANDEYRRQLQQHLLEVARGYWTLYLERAKLAQKISLYLKTQINVDQLTGRQAIDAQKSQLIQATAALESRRSDLIRARAAVRNAETRLRALINAPHLDSASEIVPLEHPTLVRIQPSLHDEFATAIQNRPEIRGAVKEVRAACVRQDMAKHEMLPVLNFVTNSYVSGLKGGSQVGDAWLDQFRDGGPSYSVGLEWEVPVGRRAASANLRRRHLERVQLGERYRATLELVKAEVEVAVREVNTSYQELAAKNRARKAAEAEAETLEVRWKSFGGRDNNASLALEALLQAQERVAIAEQELAQAQLTYSLSLINLRHANGTLLQIDSCGNPMTAANPVASEQIAGPTGVVHSPKATANKVSKVAVPNTNKNHGAGKTAVKTNKSRVTQNRVADPKQNVVTTREPTVVLREPVVTKKPAPVKVPPVIRKPTRIAPQSFRAAEPKKRSVQTQAVQSQSVQSQRSREVWLPKPSAAATTTADSSDNSTPVLGKIPDPQGPHDLVQQYLHR